jgi:hypothetical protein
MQAGKYLYGCININGEIILFYVNDILPFIIPGHCCIPASSTERSIWNLCGDSPW